MEGTGDGVKRKAPRAAGVSDAAAGAAPPPQPATGTDPRRERWRAHRAARRAEFVEAAMRAIAAHGPGFGMDEVAAEAGVSKPVLYRHFADKADLLVELGNRVTSILLERLLPAINSRQGTVSRIRTAVDAFFSVLEEHTDLYWVFARGAPIGRGTGADPISADPISVDKQLIASALATLLGDHLREFGVDSGGAEPWAHGIVGLVQNVGEWWLERRTMSREAVVEYLTQMIWAAIDGVLRGYGVVIDPDRPLILGNVHPLPTADRSDRAGRTVALSTDALSTDALSTDQEDTS
jgi:AcrR family transcriptional regulator